MRGRQHAVGTAKGSGLGHISRALARRGPAYRGPSCGMVQNAEPEFAVRPRRNGPGRVALAPRGRLGLALVAVSLALAACGADPKPSASGDHGPIAEGIMAPLGDPLPGLTKTQRETFKRGLQVTERRFSLADGLGPAFNVTFCGACHERPTFGGAAGLYRNFVLSGVMTEDGAFFPGESAGPSGGVIRLYTYPTGGKTYPARPPIPAETNVFAVRNPIPFFGVGLLAELAEEEILKRADPDDEDEDGISGRPNYDRGYVGRFGLKAQTVSIEGFIRGPLFNHLGITSDPLTDDLRKRLPVDSSGGEERANAEALGALLLRHAQAAAPESPLTDDDGAPDPELAPEDLFDLVSFTMLLAAPDVETPGPQERRGVAVFDRLGCDGCHTPRLEGPRGPLPVYSDLLLHDMGPELADGLVQKEATGSEFRTQPLWGLSAVGPYLHDGRATTIAEAIAMHGGEAERAQKAFERASDAERDDLLAFLMSLGGRKQHSTGLLAPDAPVPEPGTYGGPVEGLSEAQARRFEAGRALFDHDFGFDVGVGAPRFNGDSCRACHFEPVIGGAGPRGVDVMRHGSKDGDGAFVYPAIGTIIHRASAILDEAIEPDPSATIFEHRQTPHLFGMGLIDDLPDSVIEAGADPNDEDGDGISGRVARTADGRLGRFGWKAQVPSLVEFVRDAAAAELGLTLPEAEGLTFGALTDDDGVADPELSLAEQDVLADYLRFLGPPPRTASEDPTRVERGETLFEDVGCAKCHTPTLAGADGPVALYSDLLLHEVRPFQAGGVEDGMASAQEFRTAPLWGIARTAPYMHSGAADTLREAIRLHDGESHGSVLAFDALAAEDQNALLAFLETL